MTKIAYIIESMYNSGGMERIISQKANWFVCHNVDITIITCNQQNRSFFFHLDEKVKRINLDVNYNSSAKKIRMALKSILMNLFLKEDYDFIISTFGQEFYILNSIKDKSKKIVEFHFAFDINEKWIARGRFAHFKKILSKLYTLRMVYYAKKFDKIVVLTNKDKGKWEKYTHKVSQIYNPLTMKTTKIAKCDNNAVIAVGRMDYQKGFDYLIKAWKIVIQKHPNWILNIYGGGDSSLYMNLIENLNLSNSVYLMGVTNDMESAYLNSSIFVLSSRYEGFPLVLEEAMLCGLPIVSYNCPAGPSELIKNGINGFLISPVGDVTGLADNICKLIEDEKLRKRMSIESKLFSTSYTENFIMNKWMELFRTLD